MRSATLLATFGLIVGGILPADRAAALLAAEEAPSAGHGDWPFHPPVRPLVPKVKDPAECVNAVDAFVLTKLQSHGLSHNSRADKRTLLRRVTFDLIGLPPTREEQEAFLADHAPDAYLKVVDRLLASPHYGERWAQHWLDVVRYAETEGFKADNLRPNAYRYRDYVIQSLSADRPYDEFIRQQLAGDEMEPGNPDALIATGLNRLFPDEDNAANLFQRREEILNDITETNSLVFLGLTMGCAQCHDHKFDEIPQTDYYRLRAFFAPMVEEDDAPLVPEAQRQASKQQYAAWDKATAEIRAEMDALLAEERSRSDRYNLEKFRPDIQECYLTPAEKRTPLQEQIARMVEKQLGWRMDKSAAVKKLSEADQKQYADLEKRLAQFDSLKPEPLPVAMAVSDVGRAAPPSFLLASGDWRKPQQEIKPGFPTLLGTTIVPVAFTQPATATTGRRAALAQWLAQPDHPLTARVMVNRLWQHHFGQGIVATPSDFGAMGEPPTHADLLDWLAVDLVRNGWSLKHIHRLMVTSATYCQSSGTDPADPQHAKALAADSDNQWLWHARRRRLEGEAIRDAMLLISGQLDRRMFGTSSRPRLPEGISLRYAWDPDEDVAGDSRRSIYLFVKRNMRFPMFDAFDLPDLHNSCGRRSSTTTAPQALLMLNSRLTVELARHWAQRLTATWGHDTAGLVSEAYLAAFGREPSPMEIESAREFLSAQPPSADQPPEVEVAAGDEASAGVRADAVTDFCHALMNANEFLMID